MAVTSTVQTQRLQQKNVLTSLKEEQVDQVGNQAEVVLDWVEEVLDLVNNLKRKK